MVMRTPGYYGRFSRASGGAGTPATQANQELGSSSLVYVSPSVQHFHNSAVKFWVKWAVTTTIGVSYNVASITDTGAGDWTVNLTVSFSSANWCASYTVGRQLGGDSATGGASTQAAGSLRCISNDGSGIKADPGLAQNFAHGMGDL
jgi:hypothetical protein